MATYVIGDVHGCLDSLERLLGAVAFDPQVDQAWFVGDLVNRGPRSIETVEFVRALGSSAVTVLGNHDLFLLAVAEGIMDEEPSDRLRECLAHPAAGRALEWLRRQKLVQIDRRRRTILVHAGLPHVWPLATMRSCAARLEALLSGSARDYRHALGLLGRRGLVSPAHDPDNQGATDALTYCLNALVHLRRIAPDGTFTLDESTYNALDTRRAASFLPWFDRWAAGQPGWASAVCFGHWASLGGVDRPPFHGVDANCSKGGRLVALHVESRRLSAIGCAG